MVIMRKIFNSILLIAVLSVIISCKGFLDRLPTDAVPAEKALVTMEDAAVAVNGLYTPLKYYTVYGTYMASMGDMRADNLYPREAGGNSTAIYALDYESEQNTYFSLWTQFYAVINRCNTFLENIDVLATSTDKQEALKQSYKAEALAVRALCTFEVAKLYGYPYQYDNGASLGAVILKNTVAPSESHVPRSTVAQSYAAAEEDLKAAEALISKDKNLGHFNYWSVKLLQAKIALYKGDYSTAYAAAKEVVTSSPYRLVPNADYLAYWGKEGDDESVLELLVSTSGDIDGDGGFYTIYHNLWFDDKNAGASIIPTKKWRELFTETPNDVRAQMIAYDDPTTGAKKTGEYWLRKFIGNKDKGYTFRRNNPRVMRITEAYLIAAEAGLETGASDASYYLNEVRRRADPTATDVAATLDLIQTERQKEFIGEGHRFFDIMRRGGTITRDMESDPHDFAGGAGYHNSFSWDYYKVALPISHSERIIYPELQQNPGYKD